MFIWIGLFVLIGLLVVALGGWLAWREMAFRRRSHPAQGRCVQAVWDDTPSELARSTAYPRIEFETPDGQVVQFEGRMGTPFAGRSRGRILPVRYDPLHPQDARVDTLIETWGPALICGLTGFIIAGCGLGAGLLLLLSGTLR